jgi:hypothetical protein
MPDQSVSALKTGSKPEDQEGRIYFDKATRYELDIALFNAFEHARYLSQFLAEVDFSATNPKTSLWMIGVVLDRLLDEAHDHFLAALEDGLVPSRGAS